MLKFEIVYDEADRAIPLKVNAPTGTNPMLLALLMSQAVTAIVMQGVMGDATRLVIPAAQLPKIQ